MKHIWNRGLTWTGWILVVAVIAAVMYTLGLQTMFAERHATFAVVVGCLFAGATIVMAMRSWAAERSFNAPHYGGAFRDDVLRHGILTATLRRLMPRRGGNAPGPRTAVVVYSGLGMIWYIESLLPMVAREWARLRASDAAEYTDYSNWNATKAFLNEYAGLICAVVVGGFALYLVGIWLHRRYIMEPRMEIRELEAHVEKLVRQLKVEHDEHIQQSRALAVEVAHAIEMIRVTKGTTKDELVSAVVDVRHLLTVQVLEILVQDEDSRLAMLHRARAAVEEEGRRSPPAPTASPAA